ncbi:ABC transporter substrate-binding protein [Lichenicoccus sp.]|uniref:ABC transporter substrate-binding protein n=1 Tax=Lichenicoccus sp. TaxID=2781899 RepID=UPI003D0E6FF2
MKFTQKLGATLTVTASLTCAGVAQAATTITIATVNNADMIVMEHLSSQFEAQNPDIKLHWVTLEENVLRQRVTTDIATHSGQLDLITVGVYEVPIWGKLGWLSPFTDLPASYNAGDLLSPIRSALTIDGKLDAVPFYGESTFTIYRTDLFRARNLTMPAHPTWSQIADLAGKVGDPGHGVYGICLRGKPGWGENMGPVADMANSFGGRFFDMKWNPQFTSAPWKQAVNFYVKLLHDSGPPGVVSNGYNETLALFASGKCAMWVDATVSASFLDNPSQSKVAGHVGYAATPYQTTAVGSHWLWAWTLAVPKTSRKADAAKRFAIWATSPAYIALVAKTNGWGSVPPGTRTSTYQNADYLKAAPYAPAVLAAMQSADPTHPVDQPVPYTGISYVGIPEWQDIGTDVGQQIAAALSGQESVDAALKQAQDDTVRAMTQGGYLR